jgi:type IX secretion system PorP/SprF family membrane protein
MKRISVLLLFLTLSGMLHAQQRPMFTQYMFNGLAINPAYSALDEVFTVTAAHRQQWTSFAGAPNTQSFTVHTPIHESNTSVGLMFLRDQIGESLTDQGVSLSLAQRIPVGEESWLAAGITGGFSKYSANYSQLADNVSSLDPLFGNENDSHLNIGWGAMLFSQKYYLGLSSPFFINKTLSSSSSSVPTSERAHILFYGGYLIDAGPLFKIKPNLLLKYVKGSPVQADVNANVLIADRVWVGGSWRSFDSVDLITQLQVSENLQLGYSYDITQTGLSSVERGSHEFVLKVRFPIKGRGFPRCYF